MTDLFDACLNLEEDHISEGHDDGVRWDTSWHASTSALQRHQRSECVVVICKQLPYLLLFVLHRDGRAAGLTEGKELGLQKGLEIGSEIGFYAGFCEV